MLWARGMNLNLSAAVGFIALFGVAVMNHLRQTGLSLHEAVVEGAVERLRPVLTTVFVAVVGFLPMTLSSAPGSEIQRPLATVGGGGLLSATVLTLFRDALTYQYRLPNRHLRVRVRVDMPFRGRPPAIPNIAAGNRAIQGNRAIHGETGPSTGIHGVGHFCRNFPQINHLPFSFCTKPPPKRIFCKISENFALQKPLMYRVRMPRRLGFAPPRYRLLLR